MLYAYRQQRAPGSVRVRTGGNSPRPASCHGSVKQPGDQWLSRWNSGTDGESPEGRMRVALGGETRGSRQCPELTDSRELTGW